MCETECGRPRAGSYEKQEGSLLADLELGKHTPKVCNSLIFLVVTIVDGVLAELADGVVRVIP